jgi:hypothetical protein
MVPRVLSKAKGTSVEGGKVEVANSVIEDTCKIEGSKFKCNSAMLMVWLLALSRAIVTTTGSPRSSVGASGELTTFTWALMVCAENKSIRKAVKNCQAFFVLKIDTTESFLKKLCRSEKR